MFKNIAIVVIIILVAVVSALGTALYFVINQPVPASPPTTASLPPPPPTVNSTIPVSQPTSPPLPTTPAANTNVNATANTTVMPPPPPPSPPPTANTTTPALIAPNFTNPKFEEVIRPLLTYSQPKGNQTGVYEGGIRGKVFSISGRVLTLTQNNTTISLFISETDKIYLATEQIGPGRYATKQITITEIKLEDVLTIKFEGEPGKSISIIYANVYSPPINPPY